MSATVALGPFVFDPAVGRLSRNGVAVPLGGRALAVLTALAAQDGTATKEALLTAAWPGVIVEEGNLTVQIAALRKLLGDEAIVTVPRIGYRLQRGGPEARALPRLAVLPFVAIGGGDQDHWFADGITEDIITALGRFRGFVVVSRQGAFDQRGGDVAEIAAHFGLTYLVTGTVRRSGAALRLSARLIETATGAQLWGRSFDGRADDVFTFQDRITEAVVGAVAPQIEAAEIHAARHARAASLAVYDLSLRALAEMHNETEPGNRRAAALLERALETEPENAVCLGMMSWALGHRVVMGWPPFGGNDADRSVACALKALRSTGSDGPTLAHCAMQLIHCRHDYRLGVEVIRRAIDDNPNNVVVLISAGIVLLHCGDLDESEWMSRRAIDLSPADPMRQGAICALSHAALVSGRYEEALRLALLAYAVKPDFPCTLWMLTAANAHLGHLEGARRRCAELLALVPTSTVSRIRNGQPRLKPERIDPVLEGLALAGLPEA